MGVVEARCGTTAGRNRHREQGEPVCDACLAAAARYRRDLRLAKTYPPPPVDPEAVMLSIDPDEPWARPPMGEWVLDAACAGAPTDWFFPPEGAGIPVEARALCGICPVQADCLEHAVRIGEEYGVWGGRSAKHIARLRRATRRSIA